MASKKTINDILPPIWRDLEIEPGEVQRPISKQTFRRIMTETETIVSPSVINRMWMTLAASEFGAYSPYTQDTIFLDLPRIKRRLLSNGFRLLVENTHISHITHTPKERV